MFRLSLSAFAVAMLLPITSSALQELPVVAYSGLNFTVNGASAIGYPSSCNFLFMDANGAISGDGRFSLYGAFNCAGANEAFPVIGSGYLTNIGTASLGMTVGTATWICSLASSTFNGSCTVFGASGTALGAVQLIFTP